MQNHIAQHLITMIYFELPCLSMALHIPNFSTLTVCITSRGWTVGGISTLTRGFSNLMGQLICKAEESCQQCTFPILFEDLSRYCHRADQHPGTVEWKTGRSVSSAERRGDLRTAEIRAYNVKSVIVLVLPNQLLCVPEKGFSHLHSRSIFQAFMWNICFICHF